MTAKRKLATVLVVLVVLAGLVWLAVSVGNIDFVGLLKELHRG